jgi:hypothetical protein
MGLPDLQLVLPSAHSIGAPCAFDSNVVYDDIMAWLGRYARSFLGVLPSPLVQPRSTHGQRSRAKSNHRRYLQASVFQSLLTVNGFFLATVFKSNPFLSIPRSISAKEVPHERTYGPSVYHARPRAAQCSPPLLRLIVLQDIIIKPIKPRISRHIPPPWWRCSRSPRDLQEPRRGSRRRSAVRKAGPRWRQRKLRHLWRE